LTLKERGYVADTIVRTHALAGAFAETSSQTKRGVAFELRHPLTMLNLRGPSTQAFLTSARAALGCELPTSSNSSISCDGSEILRLGPDEWLLVAGPKSVWSDSMQIEQATLTDVSHARVVVTASGDHVLDMLAKGCPVDLHPRHFLPGACVQTGIAKIHVILHRSRAGNIYSLYVPRSYAGSFWHWLRESAAEYGFHFSDR
jgi:sarcosine oxidase subunit gamma